jgi:hypothetical protein
MKGKIVLCLTQPLKISNIHLQFKCDTRIMWAVAVCNLQNMANLLPGSLTRRVLPGVLKPPLSHKRRFS